MHGFGLCLLSRFPMFSEVPRLVYERLCLYVPKITRTISLPVKNRATKKEKRISRIKPKKTLKVPSRRLESRIENQWFSLFSKTSRILRDSGFCLGFSFGIGGGHMPLPLPLSVLYYSFSPVSQNGGFLWDLGAPNHTPCAVHAPHMVLPG